VRDYEPATALFAGEDGLEVYSRLATQVPQSLARGGHVLVEIGLNQGAAVSELFKNAGLTPTGQYKDIRGIIRTLAFTLPA
jgi:release factor glutamine methyltransferase